MKKKAQSEEAARFENVSVNGEIPGRDLFEHEFYASFCNDSDCALFHEFMQVRGWRLFEAYRKEFDA